MPSIKLRGIGELLVGSDALVPARYDIDVQQQGHRQDGQGKLEADPQILFKALRVGEATLILEDKSKISIVLTNHIQTSPVADFVTFGLVTVEQF